MAFEDPQRTEQPDIVAAMRGELADWRQWVARLVVLAYAAFSGLSVVAFTRLCDLAKHGFAAVRALHPLAPLVWTAACTALVVWLTRRLAAAVAMPRTTSARTPSVALAPERFAEPRRGAARSWRHTRIPRAPNAVRDSERLQACR